MKTTFQVAESGILVEFAREHRGELKIYYDTLHESRSATGSLSQLLRLESTDKKTFDYIMRKTNFTDLQLSHLSDYLLQVFNEKVPTSTSIYSVSKNFMDNVNKIQSIIDYCCNSYIAKKTEHLTL